MGTDARPATLVTGVAGFIGSHLAERLVERGHDVVGLDAFTPYYDRRQKEANLSRLREAPGFRFLEADLSQDDLLPAVRDMEWVFHLAAQPGVRASWARGFPDYVSNNVLGTQRLLEACRRQSVGRFILASSSSVYGNVPEGEVAEDAPLRPLSPYGVTKLASEQLVEVYHREFGLHTVSLRYFTVCGPRQRPDMAFHRILRALHGDEEFTLYGDGGQARDFTDVEDAVAANLVAAERGEPGSVYNIGGGRVVTLESAIAVLEELVGRPLRRRELPRAEGDPRRTAASLDRARAELGYAPGGDVREALRREAAWFAGPEGPLALEAEA